MSMYSFMKQVSEAAGLKFTPNDTKCGDLIPLQEWLEDVEGGGFIDYDGHGELATETETSNIMICPSEAENYEFPEWATHIMWYNR